jgi:hypothetical protein
MKKNVQKACKEYEEVLLKAAEYGGNKEKNKKIFSASMLGNDMLQNFLKFKHGSGESTQFEANTLGSIYQLGVDSAVDKTTEHKLKYTSAMRIKVKLKNDWIISGEMDQIDWENQVIFDNKVTTSTTIGKINSESRNHSYALQMAVYRWLLHENAIANEEEDIEFDTVLAVVDKGFSYFKKNKYNQLTFIETETYSFEDIEELLLKATNELDQYIELDQMPSKCKNVFPYKERGSTITKPMRCIHYCDVAKHCPYYNQNGQATINELLDL